MVSVYEPNSLTTFIIFNVFAFRVPFSINAKKLLIAGDKKNPKINTQHFEISKTRFGGFNCHRISIFWNLKLEEFKFNSCFFP